MELLSPAGNFETALIAFANGADAVYAGMDSFSARAEADNFNDESLSTLINYAHERGKKVYITFNTVIDESAITNAISKLAFLESISPDGVIVQDIGVARLIRNHFPSIPLHASTQLVAHNLEGVLAMKELGFTRVVLARELSFAEIKLIKERSGVEIEVFVHGALCYSISGLCLFSAMENNRSGNRGRCAYCCRIPYVDETGQKSLPFSMRDLRLDEMLKELQEIGVDSAKIEGRMKSPLYVASVTKRYRQLLDGVDESSCVSREDLESVFSRRTTTLYAKDPLAANDTIIDNESLGHLGTPVGTIKRITKDRDSKSWIRFHTTRALEKHDGLQFVSSANKPFGFGITEMRKAISRTPVFEVVPGDDVEVLIPQERLKDLEKFEDNPLASGSIVYCSSSNAVKRMFPIPSFRPSEVHSQNLLNVTVTISKNGISASANNVTVTDEFELESAAHPERTMDAVTKAFSRMGESGMSLGKLKVVDEEKLFAPISRLNDLRRKLVEKISIENEGNIEDKTEEVISSIMSEGVISQYEFDTSIENTLKMRLDQSLPADPKTFDEIIISIGRASASEVEERLVSLCLKDYKTIRLALPCFTQEKDFASMRRAVKQLMKLGYLKWEATDLATLRLLKNCGVSDITSDWSLYAFNYEAVKELISYGVRRAVASPENNEETLEALAISGFHFEFLDEQSTPLFISLTKPASYDCSNLTNFKGEEFQSFEMDGLWITTRKAPRSFSTPPSAKTIRTDISFSKE